MFSGRIPGGLDKDQLVDWLEQVLQPVEPSRRFLRRLRARMVMYQGRGLSSVWLLVLMGGVVLVMMAVVLGLALRLLIGLLSLPGLVRNKNKEKNQEAQPSTG
ncbi:MAG TPA: hypothetical protein G4O08_07650 [Anaerolineae bacterium]|nr:hypothetical protein [Anaerolineae bacterium]